jgi:hypothetical protein
VLCIWIVFHCFFSGHFQHAWEQASWGPWKIEENSRSPWSASLLGVYLFHYFIFHISLLSQNILHFSLRVRGQHTKTTGRRGRTVGVSKKK